MEQGNFEYLLAQEQSQSNWRTKSLNSHNLQRYSLALTNKAQHNNQERVSKEQSSQQISPKLTKINQRLFCIILNNNLTLFELLDDSQRQRRKVSSKFYKYVIASIAMPNDIFVVYGNGSEFIYIASSSEILVLSATGSENSLLTVKQIWRKRISNIKSISVIASNKSKKLAVLTSETILFYFCQTFDLHKQLRLSFSQFSFGRSNISGINGISLIAESLDVLYFFGTSTELKTDVRAKLGRNESKNEAAEKKCEALYIAKIQLSKAEAHARIFIIDHIFQLGIFTKSKVHQIGNGSFLLSLYEQIIVIRRNYEKFMVWDNVSIVPSKSNEKKGQLILADKRIMVYSQSGEISAHELYFDFEKKLLETPKIDSFKGNSNEEQILYDAIILQYKPKTYMKVLFYFKQGEVHQPLSNNQKIQYKANSGKNELFFNVMCIQQTEPTQKLKQLLQKNKSVEQIQSFLKRFGIKELSYKKSEWEVSAKGQKQIQNLLLNIQDNGYIQSELTKILQQKPHDLQFLLAVQKKQIQRYRSMVARKILLFDEENHSCRRKKKQGSKLFSISEYFVLREIEEVKLAIQWLLQSKMFYKKLLYSMSFMSFKEYDFIEIGKIKASSLREQIKLLGVKGYEKRLKYFLNSFKYSVLDDFKDTVTFLIEDLNQQQLLIFFARNFPFILPSYQQVAGEDRCQLWDNTFEQDSNKIETVRLFKTQISEEIRSLSVAQKESARMTMEEGLECFQFIFDQFRKQQWFLTNSYKQHSLLKLQKEDLLKQFEQLRDKGVYNIIVEQMYNKVSQNKYSMKKTKDVLERLKQKSLLNKDYLLNLYSRSDIYDFIDSQLKKDRKKYFDFELPPKHQFVIMKEEAFMDMLFTTFRIHLTPLIQSIYKQRDRDLFLSNIVQYYNSALPKIDVLIEFLGLMEDEKNLQFRVLTFQCICRNLLLTEENSSKKFINALRDMPIMKNKRKRNEGLIDEGKVVYATVFQPLFILFDIEQPFSHLLTETQANGNQTKIIKKMINSYLERKYYNKKMMIALQNTNMLGENILAIDIGEPLNMFSLLLFLHEKLEYQSQSKQIFKQLMFSLFNIKQFLVAKSFAEDLIKFGKLFDDKVFIEQHGLYKILNEYKFKHNIKMQVEQFVAEWVSNKYEFIESICKGSKKQGSNGKQQKSRINQTFFEISSILQMLNDFNYNNRVSMEITKISLYQNIAKISFDLFFIVFPQLNDPSNHFSLFSSFHFLLHLFQAIPNKREAFSSQEMNHQSMLSYFSNAQKQFIVLYHPNSQASTQAIFGELCRFHSQMAITLINQKLVDFPATVILQLVNTSYYCKDLIFYLVSRVLNQQAVGLQSSQKLIYELITIQNHFDVKQIVTNFIVENKLSEIRPNEEIKRNLSFIFSQILQNNQLDEAFYFCLRNLEMNLPELEKMAVQTEKFRSDHINCQVLVLAFIRACKTEIEGQNWPTFASYKKKILKDIMIIMGQLQVKHLSKKIKLLELENSHLHSSQVKKNAQPFRQSEDFQSLKKYYFQYLAAEQRSFWSSICSEQTEGSAFKLEKYPDYSVSQKKSKEEYFKKLPIIKEQQSKQVKQLQQKIFENDSKLKKIQSETHNLLNNPPGRHISQIKAQVESQNKQYVSLLERIKRKEEQEKKVLKAKQKKEESEDESQEERRKEKQKSQEETAEKDLRTKSKIVEQTQRFINELRERRKKIKQETSVTFQTEKPNLSRLSSEKDMNIKIKNQNSETILKKQMTSSKSAIPSRDMSRVGSQKQLKDKLQFLKQSTLRDQTISKILADKSGDFYVPKWEQRIPISLQNSQKEAGSNGQVERRKQSILMKGYKEKQKNLQDQREKQKLKAKERQQQIQEMKNSIMKKQVKITENEKPKRNFLEIINKYKSFNETEAMKLGEKLELLQRNQKAKKEVIKNIFATMLDPTNFINFCKDLLSLDPSYSQTIEHKAIKVLQDTIKVKVPLPIKQVFPPMLFVTNHSISLKEYYQVAFDSILSKIAKLMEQKDFNVNSVAMGLRFGLGSQIKYYYKIYEQFLRVLIRQQCKKANNQQKQLTVLAEKIRFHYNNLEPSSKKIILQTLLQQVAEPNKRKCLVSCLASNIQNKSSIMKKQQYEQLKSILKNLQK